MPDYSERSLIIHEQLRGKISVRGNLPVETQDDLSIAYTPGVAKVCEVIAEDVSRTRDLTIKHKSLAVVSDGSAVLGLGNIGPHAAIPVMEGKALLFKKYADIDAWPICLNTQDVDEIVRTIRLLEPVFGGVNLEDIAAPRCFEIERQLQDLGIPVFHDDQHGTAIVLLAGLINAAKITGRKIEDLSIVVVGAGAAGTAIAQLLRCVNFDPNVCTPVKDIVICDSKGVIHKDRDDLSEYKKEITKYTNRDNRKGSFKDVLKDADVFIGVSKGDMLNADDVKTMAKDPIIFAMANPTPEIMPDEAKKGGAAIVGTGRSDFPNQVNNVLAFPGIFKGALMAQAKTITQKMKLAAAYALANCIEDPTPEKVLPSPLESHVAHQVAQAVCEIS